MNQALTALYAKRAAITGDLDEARAKYANEPSKGVLERVDNLKRAAGGISKEIIAELGQAHARGELIEDVPTGTDGKTVEERTARTRTLGSGRDEALRSIERRSDVLDAPSGDRLVGLIERDRSGSDAEYIAAIADPEYERAFGRLVGSPDAGASSLLSADEARAVQRVGEAMRSLAIGSGPTGGYAVPLALDPTIQLTSNGVLNPLRQLASVSAISTSEWAGLTSAGVTAAFAGEGAEVGDDSPTLAQPKIHPEKAHAFVPFSIEVGADWPGIQSELAIMFQDARDTLEAEKFTSGSGTGEPFGILTGSTEVVITATKEVVANADVYALQAALPSRWQARASFLSSLTTANGIYQKSGPGSTEPALFNEDRDKLLGKPWHELSTMPTTPAINALDLLYGDIQAGFKIVDRIGATVELVPHLFGENGRPTGERGLYMYWRTGSKVVNPKAIRALKIKAS